MPLRSPADSEIVPHNAQRLSWIGGPRFPGLAAPSQHNPARIVAEVIVGYDRQSSEPPLRCYHRRLTRPVAPITKAGQPYSQSYVVCLDCGKQFEYDLSQMRVVGPFEKLTT
jgi:hypothetical protein